MITNISLNNFKSYKELQNLPITPLTVLCGANSSGKSTLFKSILSLKQSYENSSTNDSLVLNGKYVNNGFFNDVIFNRTGSSFEITNTFLINNPFNRYAKLKRKTINVPVYKALRKIFIETKEYPDDFIIKNSLTFFSDADNNMGQLPVISEYHLEIILHIKGEERKSIIKLKHTQKNTKKYSLEWIDIPDLQHKYVSGIAKDCVAYFYGLQLGNIYINAEGKPINSITSDVLPNIYTLCKLAAEQYQTVSFLGPLRQSPARAYMYTNESSAIGIMGEYTPFILALNKDKPLKALVPEFKSDKLELKQIDTTLLEATRLWLSYMNIGELDIENHEEIVKLTIDQNNIADVGFGISQILPIIVEGLTMMEEQTLILEQPEIHLHPSMQMALADFLISLVLQNKEVIIETHSDHIINRIVRRIMEENQSCLLENTSIYYINKEYNKSMISTIEIDKIHGIAKCPEDFFSQYSSEVDNIVKIGFENIQRRNY